MKYLYPPLSIQKLSHHPTMSSSPNKFTQEGLPLNRAGFRAPPSGNITVGDGGPARRVCVVDCGPPQLIHSSITRPSSKIPLPSESALSSPPLRAEKSLTLGPCHGSLTDDDDELELIDYFSTSGSASIHPAAAPTPVSRDGVSSSHWNVREQDVPTLPSFYPLEKSAVLVPHASAPAVASRIADVLRARSITSSYHGENAKVDCISESNVEFRIVLYRPRGEELGHGLVVEVQRRFGFDVSYIQDVFAILDSAEDNLQDQR